MMRPFTVLCLLAALGSGLYLYQEKHRAQLLDRDISRMVKQTEAGRDRIGLLRAEWALLTEHDRLSKLAAQYLSLQPLAPTQFAQMADLANRLPPAVIAAPEPVPVPATLDDPPALIPLAATSPMPPRAPVAIAAPLPPAPNRAPGIAAATAAAAKPAALAAAAAVPARSKPVPMQLAAVRPEPPHDPAARPEPAQRLVAGASKPEPDAIRPAPLRPVFAPIVPAYQPGPALVHAPTVQSAAATTSTYAASSYAATSPFVGSALGMARTLLAAPVPVASPSTLGR